MKILLDYETLGIPEKDQNVLGVFTHIKAEILRAVKNLNKRYDSVYTVVSITKDGLNMYYISANTALAEEFNLEMGKFIDFSKIATQITAVKNN